MSCFSESVRLYLKPPTSMPYDEHNHYRSRLSCINPTTARTPIKTPSKNQYKVLKSTTSLNGKHQPNHYPSCPTIYPSCPTIYPSCPTIYPSCPTIYPSCPTIIPLAQPFTSLAQLFTPLAQPLSLLPNLLISSQFHISSVFEA